MPLNKIQNNSYQNKIIIPNQVEQRLALSGEKCKHGAGLAALREINFHWRHISSPSHGH